jgi:hypothetical protein
MEGERRQVTVLFADIAGFTTLAEKLDPEEVHAIVDACFERITAEIHRFEGTINQYTGDGVMALFGAPIAHEDSARLSFDLWRPVTREPITTSVTVLREGRKAQTLEASLIQTGKPVARCTGVFLKADVASTPPAAALVPPSHGPHAGRPLPPHVKGGSPFFTGVDTRVVAGDLLAPGPASAWFHLTRPLVLGEENSPLVHATSAGGSREWHLGGRRLQSVELRQRRPDDGHLARAAHAVDPPRRRDVRG